MPQWNEWMSESVKRNSNGKSNYPRESTEQSENKSQHKYQIRNGRKT